MIDGAIDLGYQNTLQTVPSSGPLNSLTASNLTVLSAPTGLGHLAILHLSPFLQTAQSPSPTRTQTRTPRSRSTSHGTEQQKSLNGTSTLPLPNPQTLLTMRSPFVKLASRLFTRTGSTMQHGAITGYTSGRPPSVRMERNLEVRGE